MRDLITIVIPCKNESGYIGRLLKTIYEQTVRVPVIIADGGSTDGTVAEAKSWMSKLDIRFVEGGTVCRGRNSGAFAANTPFVLFVDADMELRDPQTIHDLCFFLKVNSKVDVVTANIGCHNSRKCDALYSVNNAVQVVSKVIGSPFSTGSFMCVRKEWFDEMRGFDEEILFAEDFWLSKQCKGSRFHVIPNKVYTSDRRFKKVSYWWMIKNCFLSFVNRNNRKHFTSDFKYWE